MKQYFSGKFISKCCSTAVISLFICSCSKPPAPTAPPPGVVVAPVIKEDIVDSYQFVGQTVAKDDVDLKARVEGFLTKKCFKDGSYVKKGDLLFQIEKAPYIAQVNAAKADLAQQEAILTKAQIDYDRNKTLYDKKAVSKQDLDNAVCEKETAVAQIQSSKAQLEEANLNLSYTDIYSPFDGKLGIAKYSVGDLVGSGSEALSNVVNLDPMKVEFSISEAYMVSALQKREIKVKGGTGEENYIPKLILPNQTEYKQKGEINFWNNKINSTTGTIIIRAIFPNPQKFLVPGMYVKVILESKNKVSVMLIPQAAVQEDQAGNFVLVVDKQKKVQEKRIKTGDNYGINVVVREGLEVGEEVITQGLQKVRTGMVVDPVVDKAFTNESEKKPAADSTKKSADATKKKTKAQE